MKKILLLAVCLMMIGMQSVMAQTATVMLMHEGTPKYFNPSHLSDALDIAVDGDSLLLSEGSFAGNFTITKHVCLIGAGTKTVISGGITVALEDSLMTDAYMLDAMYIMNDITVTKAVNGLKIRKCSFLNISFSGRTDFSIMENCYCRGTFNMGPSFTESESSLYGMIVYNSKLANVYGSAVADGAAVLDHCNIKLVTIGGNTKDNRVTFQSSIIGGWSNGLADYYGTPYGGNSIYINCLCNGSNYSTGNPARYTDCWQMSDSESLTDDIEYANSKTYSQYNYDAMKYLKGERKCSDGTEVGITGGSLPYTLTPTLPTVTESTSTVDNANKKLRVTLKVSSN